MSVNHGARSGGKIGVFFSIVCNIKVYCVFSLELSHRGDSNEYTQYTIFNMKKKKKKKNILNYSKSGIFPRDSSTSSKQPGSLKFYCIFSFGFLDLPRIFLPLIQSQ